MPPSTQAQGTQAKPRTRGGACAHTCARSRTLRRLPLGAGENEIQFEALDISGAWRPVGSVRLNGIGEPPARQEE